MQKKKRSKPIYAGALGTKGLIEELSAKEALSIKRRHSVDLESLITLIRAEIEDKFLRELLRHYRIPEEAIAPHKLLAMELARQHVPAFSRGPVVRRGRPSTVNHLARLLGLGTKRRAGRPRNPSLGPLKRQLIEKVCAICEQEGFSGRGARTRALEFICAEQATRQGRAVAAIKRRNLPYLRKLLNSAEKLHPEIAAKLPA